MPEAQPSSTPAPADPVLDPLLEANGFTTPQAKASAKLLMRTLAQPQIKADSQLGQPEVEYVVIGKNGERNRNHDPMSAETFVPFFREWLGVEGATSPASPPPPAAGAAPKPVPSHLSGAEKIFGKGVVEHGIEALANTKRMAAARANADEARRVSERNIIRAANGPRAAPDTSKMTAAERGAFAAARIFGDA